MLTVGASVSLVRVAGGYGIARRWQYMFWYVGNPVIQLVINILANRLRRCSRVLLRRFTRCFASASGWGDRLEVFLAVVRRPGKRLYGVVLFPFLSWHHRVALLASKVNLSNTRGPDETWHPCSVRDEASWQKQREAEGRVQLPHLVSCCVPRLVDTADIDLSVHSRLDAHLQNAFRISVRQVPAVEPSSTRIRNASRQLSGHSF